MQKKSYCIANWKLYLSVKESIRLAQKLVHAEKQKKFSTEIEIVIAPSMLALQSVCLILKHARSKIKIAAQDCGFMDSGALTGSVSPRELKKLGVSHVIVGHSERREYFGEVHALLLKKIAAARSSGLDVIYCVGETKEERHEGRAQNVVKEQLQGVKKNVSIIAYEPRWSIFPGSPIEPVDAEKMHEYIAREIGSEISICYGGSVSEKNVAQFFNLSATNGVLVGNASTNSRSFLKIVEGMKRVEDFKKI